MILRVTFYFALLWILVLIFPLESRSQLVVVEGTTIGLTPQEFVETYLVGTGITISNALYNGSAEPLNSTNRIPLKARDQIGSFTNSGGAELELGIDGGVLLSTGYTGKAIAGFNPSDNMWGNSQPQESDPDLVILANSQINDKSVLEFDFVPQTDVVTFRYVFGSIEFDSFCGSINDAFGLFLSGPGISGGLGFVNDAVNIALLPNSSNYVNIFNICAADQGNHGLGVYSWWNEKHDFFSYHRLTYVFTASYTVACNQTYHMKFAIGDASDGILDSGVFLEQNSFTSNNVSCVPTFSNPLTGELLIEGQNNVTLVYSILQTRTTDVTIDLAIQPSGTATQDDILPNPFPSSVTIPAGLLQSPPILITPVIDLIPEPDEILVIKGTSVACGVSTVITTEIIIVDYIPLIIDLSNDTVCDGSSVTLTPNIIGGQQILPDSVYIYLWSTAETTASIIVSPPAGHHVYTVTVTDACNQSATKEVSVDVGATPGPADPIEGPDSICTPLTGVSYSIGSITGAETYLWTLPTGATITGGANTNSILVDFDSGAVSGNISVKGHSTSCGDGSGSSLLLTIHPSAEPAGPITGPVIACQGPDTLAYLIAPLAFTTNYEWSVPPGVTIVSGMGTNEISCLFTTSAVSGDFAVRGYNAECGYGSISALTVIINPLPGDAGTIASANGSEVCQNQTGVLYSIAPIPNTTDYLWNFTGTGATMSINGPELLLDFSLTATPGVLTVIAQNGCGSGAESPPFPINVKPKPTVGFTVCNTVTTTKNGRPILLKGGNPIGDGGVYSGTGVSLAAPGKYVFDPQDPDVIGGGPLNGIDYPVNYRYTNSQGCFDDKTITITVYGSNANDPCPGTLKDHRDGIIYPTILTGTGPNARCWMAANLNYGIFTDQQIVQTDNCIAEKYCPGNLPAQCENSGGYYQWQEIMEYQENGIFQDLCPTGWHVPTSMEWQDLADDMAGYIPGYGLAGSILTDPNATPAFNTVTDGILYLNNTWAFTSANVTIRSTMFWTSTLAGNQPIAHGLNTISPSVSIYESSKANAFPIRCIKD